MKMKISIILSPHAMSDLAPPARPMAPSSEHDCIAAPEGRDTLRCTCGNLLARYVAGGVELKCRRCKRTVTIPIENDADPRDGAEAVKDW